MKKKVFNVILFLLERGILFHVQHARRHQELPHGIISEVNVLVSI